jgi:thiosulfate/3-mercaptopyruvate sulfurtransferase
VKNSGVVSPLVSCTDLAVSLTGAEPPVLLDVRWRLGGPPGRADYAQGHLPGAVFVDLDTELAAPPGPAGRHPLPEPSDLQQVLRAAGVREGVPVVVYDADNGSVAARLWWLLRWVGHDRVRLLDGGFAAWVAEGRPVTTDVPTPVPGDVTVRPGHMPVMDADGAAELARGGVLLDARAPERYCGEVEPIDPKAGHVPGARNAPFAAHTDESGRWRTPEELAGHFAKLGVPNAGGANTGGDGTVSPKRGGAGAVSPEKDRDMSAEKDPDGRTAAEGPGDRVVAEDSGDRVVAEGPGGRVVAEGPGDRVVAEDSGDRVVAEGPGDRVAAEDSGDRVAAEGPGDRTGVGGMEQPVVGAYCGSGVTATSVVLALEVAGITSPAAPASLYAGSWSNWSADPTRPVATGDEPA